MLCFGWGVDGSSHAEILLGRVGTWLFWWRSRSVPLMLVPRPRWRLDARHSKDPHMGWGSAGVSRWIDMTVTIWLISRGQKHVKTQVKSEGYKEDSKIDTDSEDIGWADEVNEQVVLQAASGINLHWLLWTEAGYQGRPRWGCMQDQKSFSWCRWPLLRQITMRPEEFLLVGVGLYSDNSPRDWKNFSWWWWALQR